MTKVAFILFLSILAAIAITSCKHQPLVADVTPMETTGTGGNGGTTGNGGGTDTSGNGGNNGTPCDPNVVYFVNDVLPIFQTNCAKSGCHNAASHEKDIVLDSYANIVNTGDIEAGNPNHGKIFESITDSDPDDKMPPPPNPPLTAAQIQTIYNWIMQGTQNNECTNNVCDTSNASYNMDIKPIVQNRCIGCHSNALQSGGFNFTTYDGLHAAYASGKLHGAINHMAGFVAMPQNGTLSDCELGLLNSWIAAGAPNN